MRPQVFSIRYVASFAGNLCIETQRIALIYKTRSGQQCEESSANACFLLRAVARWAGLFA
jgi:hypothetical protein|eukprot:COSAG06_NODE_1841_length_8237_cov_11.146965_4_plen_60_part_00